LDHNSPTYAYGIIDMHHYAQFVEMRVLLTVCLDWPQIMILPISVS
jgi:hypothetical protein